MRARIHLLLSALLAAVPAALLAAALSGPAAAAEAPAPRAPAALPNWTGLWETEAATILSATGKLQPPKLWGKPPYNAEWEKKAQSAGANGKPAAPPTDLPPAVKVCEPAGFPAAMEHPVPDHLFELLVTPEQTLLVSSDGAIRHIYTDGRQHPKNEDLWPTAEGHSIGHWEGDTLVIDTIARKAGPVGPPLPGIADLSEQAHFTERLRLLDADTLQNHMTIDDPPRFSHPWQVVIRYKRAKNVDRMIAVNCRENDRNPVVDGSFVITPPAQVASDEVAIRRLATQWEQAWNRHDMNGLVSLVTDDADFVNVGARHWKGRREIEAEHTARLSQFLESTWATKAVTVQFVKPDVALAHVDWFLKGDKDPDGTPRSPRGGVFTWVVVKQADAWLIRSAQNTNLGPLAAQQATAQ